MSSLNCNEWVIRDNCVKNSSETMQLSLCSEYKCFQYYMFVYFIFLAATVLDYVHYFKLLY